MPGGDRYKTPEHVRREAVARVLAGEQRKDVAADMGLAPWDVGLWADKAVADAEAERAASQLAPPKIERGVLHPAMLGEVTGL